MGQHVPRMFHYVSLRVWPRVRARIGRRRVRKAGPLHIGHLLGGGIQEVQYSQAVRDGRKSLRIWGRTGGSGGRVLPARTRGNTKAQDGVRWAVVTGWVDLGPFTLFCWIGVLSGWAVLGVGPIFVEWQAKAGGVAGGNRGRAVQLRGSGGMCGRCRRGLAGRSGRDRYSCCMAQSNYTPPQTLL